MHTEVDAFLHFCSWFARQVDESFARFVTSAFLLFLSGNRTTARPATQGKRAEVSAALFRRCAACKPARMSHKERPTFYRQELNKTMWEVPERYQSLSPVGSGAYGSVWYGIFFFLNFILCYFLQSIYVEHCTTAEWHSLPIGGLSEFIERSIRSRSINPRKKTKSTFAHMCVYRIGLFSSCRTVRVARIRVCVWVGISFVFVHICFAILFCL